MRILALTETSDRSESSIFCELSQLGCRVDVLGRVSPYLQDQFLSSGINYRQLSFRSKLDFAAMQEILIRLEQFDPQIVHAFTSRSLACAIMALWRRDFRLGRRTAGLFAYRGTVGHLSRLNPACWLTYFNPRIDRIMCVSDAVKDYLSASAGVPADRLFAAAKGHDVAWYSAKPRDELRQFNIPPSSLVVCSVANMRPVKGIDLLLEAALKLPLDGSVHYLLFGEVRDNRVKVLAEDPRLSKIVRLAGYNRDASSFAGACDIFVMPSRAREGLPKAAIEAMALSVPVVVSNAGGLPEIVRDNIDGLVCQAGSADSLAGRLIELLKNPDQRKALGAAARERIIKSFSPRHTAQLIYREYLAAMQNKSSHCK